MWYIQLQFIPSLTVLVTGGANFIGFHTSLRLTEKGHKVVLLDNFNNDEAFLKKKASILSEKGKVICMHYDKWELITI